MAWKKPSKKALDFLSKELRDLGCERRKMFGYPVFFVNSNMFTGVYGDDLFIRLSPQDREKILEERDDVSPFTPREGMTMKEYVVLSKHFYTDVGAFRGLLGKSFTYVSSLPPKRKGRSTE